MVTAFTITVMRVLPDAAALSSFSRTLGVCLVALTVALIRRWILLHWRQVRKIVFDHLFSSRSSPVSFLHDFSSARDTRNEQQDCFLNEPSTHD
jgi:hypothetical protein